MTSNTDAISIAKSALRADRKGREDRLESARRAVALSESRQVRTTLTTSSYPADTIKNEFRVFLTIVWRHLLGQDPSPDQLSMAHYAQRGPDRSIIMAFRGMSKSWIVGAFALWLLLRNPQLKVMIVSGSLKRAVATTTWCLALIRTMPLLAHLAPRMDQRQSAQAFDVAPSMPDQSPSFHAVGVSGQMVGYRADFILGDDVETQTNSLTVIMRDKVRDAVKEFESVLKPGGVIKFLGTFHDTDSLYVTLWKTGVYECRMWPALFPRAEDVKKYEGRLHPYVTHALSLDPSLAGTPIQPRRFPYEDLMKRKAAMGDSEFALQYLLDLSLYDRDKFPLKVRDLLVLELDIERGPESITWGTGNRIVDLPLLGLSGDYYFEPMHISERSDKWSSKVAFIDPSGQGKDEVGMTVAAELNGKAACLYNNGWQGGSSPENLAAIAKVLVRFDVTTCKVESNFGDGMFEQLLRPVVDAEWKKQKKLIESGNDKRQVRGDTVGMATEIVSERASNQSFKEKRILDVLEPVIQNHKLMVAREVIRADGEAIVAREEKGGGQNARIYSLMFQLTHLTRQRDSLKHDDRVESLAGAISMLGPMLGLDGAEIVQRKKALQDDEELARIHGELDELHAPRGSSRRSSGYAARPVSFQRRNR